ncbi:MAG: acyclic terpene utilization AtuA family protein [bacterium]|nr:acyclic terpene utilization AtuA family protein [bacterium]
MSRDDFRILSFVNHIPVHPRVDEFLAETARRGVDAVCSQGTGMDFGPYMLGSGTQFTSENFRENVRPYMRFAKEQGVPFVFSVGIAGGRTQLDECLDRVDEITSEEDLSLRIAVIDGEVDREMLTERIRDGAKAPRAVESPHLSEMLTPEDVEASEHIVAQMGPEPIMAALEAGVDGVITGRALDVGIYMAPPLAAGFPRGSTTHMAKVLECAGLALHPGDPSEPIYGVLEPDAITVYPVSDTQAATARSIASHSMYERDNPFMEKNPGGYLDLTDATYTEVPGSGVRSEGAIWVDTPYTIKLEGARREGYRTIAVFGVREPAFIDCLDWFLDNIRSTIAGSPRFGHLDEGKHYKITFDQYGRNGVLGPNEPLRGRTPHEIGLLVDVIAETQELAENLAYFICMELWIKPYPNRQTSAGNLATRFAPPTINVGPAFSFNVWHLLEVEDPLELFPYQVVDFPRGR